MVTCFQKLQGLVKHMSLYGCIDWPCGTLPPETFELGACEAMFGGSGRVGTEGGITYLGQLYYTLIAGYRAVLAAAKPAIPTATLALENIGVAVLLGITLPWIIILSTLFLVLYVYGVLPGYVCLLLVLFFIVIVLFFTAWFIFYSITVLQTTINTVANTVSDNLRDNSAEDYAYLFFSYLGNNICGALAAPAPENDENETTKPV